MVDKADWSDFYWRHLIDVCKGEIEAGNSRPLGIYTSCGRKNIISKFEEKASQKRTRKQFKNKLDAMKKEYTVFMEFTNYATGLGWNDAKQTVDCPDEWWADLLAARGCLRCNNTEKGIKCSHVKFRKQELKYLDDLHIVLWINGRMGRKCESNCSPAVASRFLAAVACEMAGVMEKPREETSDQCLSL